MSLQADDEETLSLSASTERKDAERPAEVYAFKQTCFFS